VVTLGGRVDQPEFSLWPVVWTPCCRMPSSRPSCRDMRAEAAKGEQAVPAARSNIATNARPTPASASREAPEGSA